MRQRRRREARQGEIESLSCGASSGQMVERASRGGERRVALERELIFAAREIALAAILGDPSKLEVRDGKRRVHLHCVAKRPLGAPWIAGGARHKPFGERAVKRRRGEPAAFGD